jgi:hypothetical protein
MKFRFLLIALRVNSLKGEQSSPLGRNKDYFLKIMQVIKPYTLLEKDSALGQK